MSFSEGPTLSEQYWWTWNRSLQFVLLKQGKWIMMPNNPAEIELDPQDLHLKDRFVDLTRITSNETES